MARTCTVCAHECCDEIDRALAAGATTLVALAEKHGLSAVALGRHKRRHHRAELSRARWETELARLAPSAPDSGGTISPLVMRIGSVPTELDGMLDAVRACAEPGRPAFLVLHASGQGLSVVIAETTHVEALLAAGLNTMQATTAGEVPASSPADPMRDILTRTIEELSIVVAEDAEKEQPLECVRYATVAALAGAAGVPVEVAEQAQAHGLLKAGHRGFGKSDVRWLKKLGRLVGAGLVWDEIRDWSKRRWKPEHADERLWPAGFEATIETHEGNPLEG